MKRLSIYALALAVVLGSATAASERARAFLLPGQTQTQSGNSPTASISANPAIIPNGGSSSPLPALLTWTSTSATSCTGTGFSTGGAISGSASVSPTTTTNYSVTCSGTGGTSSPGSAAVTVSGNLINAATGYCAAHGGGDGSGGNPWQAACIQAAMNAASSGDTVYLASGNWALNTGNAPATTSKTINLVGAGSGNTFDVYGHPNNASGADLTATTSNNITRIYTTGTNTPGGAGAGGYVQFYGSNETVSHIFVDGSLATDGGDQWGTLNFYGASGPTTVSDIRVLAFANGSVSQEVQFFAGYSNNITVQNSTINAPVDVSNPGYYAGTGGLQTGESNYVTVQNTYFWEAGLNPIASNNVVMTSDTMFLGTDGSGNRYNQSPSQGWAGCGIGPGAGCVLGGTNGSYYYTVSNSYFDTPGLSFGLGGGLNDPGNAGGNNALTFTGNTLIGDTVAIDSCVWHYYTPSTGSFYACPPNVNAGGSEGMQINGTVNSDCSESASPSAAFTSTNNSIIGTTSAQLDAAGTGIVICTLAGNVHTLASFTGSISGTTLTVSGVSGTVTVGATVSDNGAGHVAPGTHITAGSGTTWTVSPSQTVSSEAMVAGHDNTVVNFDASQNYLSSPANAYVTSAETINPSVNNNYCAQGSNPYFSGCTTTGFTTPPTCSFTLGTLSGSTVPFNSTSFTAQYGAVQWLASTLATTPTSGGQADGNAWSYLPPVSLASVAHGTTVYAWTMDSANHIAACGSVYVP
jgi:hypothetical protein